LESAVSVEEHALESAASVGYSPSAAVSWADSHCASDDGTECAEFVSNALKAGGHANGCFYKWVPDLDSCLRNNAGWKQTSFPCSKGSVVIWSDSQGPYHAALSRGDGTIDQHNPSRCQTSGSWGSNYCLSPASFTETAVAADTCSLFEIADGSCGQSDLNCDYVKYAKAAEKGLADGTCADQGYTVQTGTQTKSYPVIGDIVITTYSKPSLKVAYTCESLCEFTVGTMKTLINKEGCVAAEVEGAAACEAAGGGPEDPVADICAAIAAQACTLIAGHLEESNSAICHSIGVCGGVMV
jgi:hypothetical protein